MINNIYNNPYFFYRRPSTKGNNFSNVNNANNASHFESRIIHEKRKIDEFSSIEKYNSINKKQKLNYIDKNITPIFHSPYLQKFYEDNRFLSSPVTSQKTFTAEPEKLDCIDEYLATIQVPPAIKNNTQQQEIRNKPSPILQSSSIKPVNTDSMPESSNSIVLKTLELVKKYFNEEVEKDEFSLVSIQSDQSYLLPLIRTEVRKLDRHHKTIIKDI